MSNPKLMFTLWDVGHGVSIWIQYPERRQPLDRPRPEPRNSRRASMSAAPITYPDIDYLVISHPDKDHLEDLPQFRATFGDPRVCVATSRSQPPTCSGSAHFSTRRNTPISTTGSPPPFPTTRNRPIPTATAASDNAHQSLDHGTRVKRLHFPRKLCYRNATTPPSSSCCSTKECCSSARGTSSRSMAASCGDAHAASYCALIDDAHWRFLVAPHHGRKSGYCRDMMGRHPTACHFRQRCLGRLRDPPGFPQRSPRRPVPIGRYRPVLHHQARRSRAGRCVHHRAQDRPV